MAAICTPAELTSFAHAQADLSNLSVHANWALIGLNACLILLSACAVWVRVKSGEGFRLFRNVEGLWSPNAPLLASLCLGIYGALAIAVLVLLAAFANGRSRLGVVLNVFGLVPSCLFGWAWFHALGTVAHFNRLVGEGVGRRWAGWSKKTFNGVMVGVTGAVVACLTITLPILVARFVNETADGTKAALDLPADATATEVSALWAEAIDTCHTANRLYRTLWSLWTAVFVSVLLLYLLYSLLLNCALATKLRYLRPAPRPSSSFGGSWEEKVAHHGHGGSSRSADRPGAKNQPAARMADRGKTQRAVRDLETTLLLAKWEAAGFAAYCASWGGLSLYRAVRGLNLLLDLRGWGKLGAASLWVATVCGCVIVVCIILRTRVILAAQERALSSVASLASTSTRPTHRRDRSGSGRPTSIHVTVETMCKVVHEHAPASPDCATLDMFGTHCVHLHEPARPEPALVRVRFPALGEEDEDEDDKKGPKPVVVRQDSMVSSPGSGWSAPAGWETPRVVASPMTVYSEEEIDEIQVLSFGPLAVAGSLSPLQPSEAGGSPEIEEK